MKLMRTVTVKMPPITVDLPSFQLLERFCAESEKPLTVSEAVRRGLIALVSSQLQNAVVNPEKLTYANLFVTPSVGRPKKVKVGE